ncbi:hypothetical protein [Escherichia coli]|uniref:hypothetical protein n=1 Tax=Escherichia coli TaxID=562 RepID=UPI00388E9EAC
MGEIKLFEPVTGSFAVYAHRYEPVLWLSHRSWSYWFMWMAVGIQKSPPLAFMSSSVSEMAQWIPAQIAVALVALANLAAVRLYGEIEFWFAMIKVSPRLS